MEIDPALLPKKGGGVPPQFSAHFYCGQTAGCIKMPLGMDVGLSPGDFVLDGDPFPLPKRGRSPLPNFRPAHFYCGRTAGWIKMALGIEVGLSPGDFVSDGDPASSLKMGGTTSPIFGPFHFYCGRTAGCIKMPLGMEVGLSPGDVVLDGGPSPYPERGRVPPNFRPMSIVAKRLHG